ncbi:uncharacterized protein LOC103475519 isoform X1 [Poecilia reticulata]|uniref:uncharacterized protein LOC103475519 isoform X1 n=1 Tax=Poecilia reticulata TaxID=8081 RepID=UPI0004A4A70D|nr:PREDICTED: uncharacterized protein LOC103475519 isoform X1 [Poecilia reticulata]
MGQMEVALTLVSLALLISVCLNIIFCYRQRHMSCKEPHNCCQPHGSEEETLSQIEGQHFGNVRHQEEQENPHNHHERQENPIYGNISTERRGSSEVCYETMSMQRTRDCLKPPESDLNYASLDLKIAKNRKKNRHMQGQAQGRHKKHDSLAEHPTSPLNAFLEVDTEVDAHLPSRDTSVMVSHSSIYLNSQQIAQEAEEMERERGINMDKDNVGWDGLQESEEGRRRDWDEDQESEDRKDDCDNRNGNICIELSEVENTQSCSDQVTDSFGHDCV